MPAKGFLCLLLLPLLHGIVQAQGYFSEAEPSSSSSAASAELAGEAALGGLRRRLELDAALSEVVRAGHAAGERLRSQAEELRRLRAENADLRDAVADAAAVTTVEKRADVGQNEEAEEAGARPILVAPPPSEGGQPDRDLTRLAGLLARHAVGEGDAAAANGDGDGEEGGVCFPAGTPLAGCAQVRRRFGLAMDAEAAALCDSHRLCVACSGSYGIASAACDRAFVSAAASLCMRESDPVGCGRQADALLAAARAVHVPADAVAAEVVGCRRSCAAGLMATVRGDK